MSSKMYRKIGKLEVVEVIILFCHRCFNTRYWHCHSLRPYRPAVTRLLSNYKVSGIGNE